MLLNILRGIKPVAVILVSLLFIALYSSGDDDKKKISKPTGINISDSYRLEINRIKLPLNNRGVLANVSVDGGREGGFFDGKGFLFSGGFMLSGKNEDTVWMNGNASASRIEDYLPGEVGGTDEPRALLYVVNSEDEPFGESWQEWRDAVDLGADYYDGDNDGIYNPTDKNGNGEWDPDEDMPDLLGDETVWCVYNDAQDASLRRFSDQDPMGIEIRQTVWAYADSNYLDNVVFVRWSINNAGTVSDVFDSVYFGAWADTDLGDFNDDLVGSDTTIDAGYTYNDGPDNDYGIDPPTFIISLLQGAKEETGNQEDMAFNVKGPTLGVDTIFGSVNLPMTSFIHYMSSHPTQGDPDNIIQARNYLTGKNQAGDVMDPCNWRFGKVVGEDCALIDKRFMYSGDPVADKGWINTPPFDQRQMSNTGPFTLEKDKPVDIIVAYVVGRGTSALYSISVAKQISRIAQIDFKNNYTLPAPLPQVVPVIKTTDNSIELIWETSDHLAYREAGRGSDIMFESYEVYMHETNSLADEINGRQNAILIASYDVANDIKTILLEDPASLQRNIIYIGGIQLDSSTYADPIKGRISLEITTDPFTERPLIKGRPYFISIMPAAYNREELIKLDAFGKYLIPGTAVIGRSEGTSAIFSDGVSQFGIVPGKDTYTPFRSGITADHIAGTSESMVTYDVKDKSKTTDHEYEVSFIFDSASALYDLYFKVTDLDNGKIEVDSSKNYNMGSATDMVGGAVVNIEWLQPEIRSIANYYVGTGTPWFDNDTIPYRVGTWYMGKDVIDPLGFPAAINPSNKSKITRALDMKSVELRFGQTGKAYRYLRKLNSNAYKFAGDSGFVGVPFQAWAVEKVSGKEYQLAVGFTESAFSADTLGNPDGIYDPGTDVFGSKEYIIIFNSPYDPDGNAYAYTGRSGSWARMGVGYNLSTGDPRFNDSLKTVAKSPYFDAIYVSGIQRAVGQETAEMIGIYNIEVFSILTPEDRYRFKVNLDITADTERDLFNKINVFPNPLFAYNAVTAYTGESGQYVTFSFLPEEVTIKIYSLAGYLIRTLEKNDESPYMKWDLKNEYGNRVGSGMYLAIVSNLRLGEKILKFAIIQPKN
ncbi:MAG: hypothetical protein BMS9Abin39_0082 [Ignavibacteria bacterium]|nr:MAG: hypothetical protein BMS9Abin39_0082 [Ignavibacteria bacterium]